MSVKKEMRLSGNSIALTVSFVNRTKTNHDFTYNKKIDLFLVHKFCCENRRTYERNILC